MKKALILTGATGGGHDQVASTITEELQGQKFQVKTIDILSGLSKIVKFFVIDGYSFMYRTIPKFYGILYRLGNARISNSILTGFLYLFLRNKLVEIIEKEKPDVIISVHPFGSGVVGALKKYGAFNAPFVVIVTDFKSHLSHIGSCVDMYITGSEYTKDTLVKRGVDSSIIYPFGIPIRKDFLEQVIYEKHGDKFNVMIMGGSDGSSHIKKATKYVLKRTKNQNVSVTIICGKNEKLRMSLHKKYARKYKNIRILGYSKKIKTLMNRADVIVTKPGAITTAEAVSQNLPIIIPFYIPGHEKDNANFLVKAGIARKVKSMSKLGKLVASMAENPTTVQDLKEHIQENPVSYQTDKIVDIISQIS